MKLIRVVMAITALLCLNSCMSTMSKIVGFVMNSKRVDPEATAKKIEQYPGVKEVVFVAVERDDFKDWVGVSLLLEEGGSITVFYLNSALGGNDTAITEIGFHQVQSVYFEDYDNTWHDISFVNTKELEPKIGHRLRSLKSIIKHYNAILPVIERDYVKTSQ